jgi:hypothetical protein
MLKRNPIKDIPIGTLVRFVNAPPRWKGEDPRPPGHGILGEVAVVLDYCGSDAHGWGGVYMLHQLSNSEQYMHWGDFMEIIQ